MAFLFFYQPTFLNSRVSPSTLFSQYSISERLQLIGYPLSTYIFTSLYILPSYGILCLLHGVYMLVYTIIYVFSLIL